MVELPNLWPKRKKTPFILQMEAVECGAAALAMILGYYGRFVPLTQLRVDCGVSRDGSKAANVLKAARKYGLTAKGFSKGMDTIKQVPLPCIVFWQFNHFLVVEGFDKGRVYLNDPAIGHRELTEEEFSEGFTGVALTFEPEETFEKGGRLPSPFPAILERIRGSEQALTYIMVCGLLSAFPAIVTAAFTRLMVDEVIAVGRFEMLRPILLGMIAVLAFQVALTAVNNLFFRRMSKGLSAKLNAEFFRHILRLPYQFYSQRYAGDVVERSQINDMLVELIAGQLTGTVVGLITMVFYGLVLFSYDLDLTLIGLFSTFLNFAFMQAVAARRMEANLRIATEMGKVQGVTIAAIQSVDSLKASGLESAFYEKWAGYFTSGANAQLRLTLDSRTFSILPTFTNSVVSTLTLLIGGFKVMNGEMTFGTLMAFNALMGMFLGPINGLLGLGIQIQQIRGNIIRLEDVTQNPTIDRIPPPPEPPGAPEAVVDLSGRTRLEGQLEMIDIQYGYSPTEAPLITAFNLKVLPGQRVALVGGSGSGKSTLARMAAGLIQPWAGAVRFDGVSRHKVPAELLTNSVAMIEQDILLFPGTIRDNLTLWDATVPEQWLLDALEDADIAEFVMGLAKGLDTKVEEGGGNMSGGQRQRLEIARALVRKPSFLILDEATSALDSETEATIMRNLNRRGCSALIVAHRLSTVRTCDRILVLQKGKVRESGSHDELWAKQGLYAKLLKAH
ncbi:MAG: NHLP family bacteriocin export ABC transporter peptidase/permease/ATPase subunit [Magnetococcales bacterium]|nr:NHLP family bacteriocin export ABC transporter peptidase/permease/ATPase subunit [Magnetococcales bacterium]